MHNLIDGYKALLASNFVLYHKTHCSHFNVTGMFFQSLHALFKDQYEDLWEAHDVYGENMRKLDAFVPCGLAECLRCSAIDDALPPMPASEMIRRIMLDHDRMISLLNVVFKLAEAENKQADMNFMAERLDAHAKMRWMLKASLEGAAQQPKVVDVAIRL